MEDELARRAQSKVDDYEQDLIAHKEAVLKAMANESEDEEEDDDLFKDL